MNKPLRALILEDVERDAALVVRELRRADFDLTFERVDTAEGMAAALDAQAWDIVISDYSMRQFDAPAALSLMRGRGLDLPFIIVSGTVGEETAVQAMRAGAHDFFPKDRLGAKFIAAVERELAEADVRRERRQATLALERSQERLEGVLEHSRFVLYSCEATTGGGPDGDFALTFVSRNVERVLGYSVSECLRPAWWEAGVQPDDLRMVLAALPRAFGDGVSTHEYRFRHRDGSWRWISDHMRVTKDPQGKVTGFNGSLQDVTEQKGMQEQLLVSDRMASIGTLAAGVAHEINNPLAALMANLDFAAEDVAKLAEDIRGRATGDSPEGERGTLDWLATQLREIAEPLQDARESADRVRLIVRDLKIFSRSDEEQKGAVDVRRVMESSLRMAWNEIRHRAQLAKDYGEVPSVVGNEARLGQVFLNLVVNAAQAMPEGRADKNEIRVVTKQDGPGRVIVEVRDTGPGIPESILSRIFDPFFTTKPIGVGTGLGLAICHRIVTAAGGEIRCESEVGKGTVFRVVLPVASDETREAPASRRVAIAGRRGRVLVVDDEPTLGTAIRRMLSQEHDVTAVTNARDAIGRVARGERFDVILCDLMMPEVTGMDLHAELVRLAPDQAEKVVFMTGGAFTSRAREFLDEVRNPRAEKPFDAGTLRALIHGLVR